MNICLMRSFQNVSHGSSFFFSDHFRATSSRNSRINKIVCNTFYKNRFIQANMFCCYDNSVINIKHLFGSFVYQWQFVSSYK